MLHRVNRVEVVMNEIVDRVLQNYQLNNPLDAASVVESREKVSQYVAKLASAGQNDRRRLIVFARAYLKELHQGPDRRFTGC
jgi:hypothetical protein